MPYTLTDPKGTPKFCTCGHRNASHYNEGTRLCSQCPCEKFQGTGAEYTFSSFEGLLSFLQKSEGMTGWLITIDHHE